LLAVSKKILAPNSIRPPSPFKHSFPENRKQKNYRLLAKGLEAIEKTGFSVIRSAAKDL